MYLSYAPSTHEHMNRHIEQIFEKIIPSDHLPQILVLFKEKKQSIKINSTINIHFCFWRYPFILNFIYKGNKKRNQCNQKKLRYFFFILFSAYFDFLLLYIAQFNFQICKEIINSLFLLFSNSSHFSTRSPVNTIIIFSTFCVTLSM